MFNNFIFYLFIRYLQLTSVVKVFVKKKDQEVSFKFFNLI